MTTTFSGPLRSQNGLLSQGPGAVVPITTSTLTLDPLLHGGRLLTIGTGTTTITLPAVAATNLVDPNVNMLGVSFEFLVTTVSVAAKLITASASDFLLGSATVALTAGALTDFFANGTTIRSVNLNGTTTGGIVGSYFKVVGAGANIWMVQGALLGSGVVATPFATS